ncbi:hypothetical protein [Uliginosibacterium sp. H1]|uniref:hypothetical protein n=1 Tax=Uliginosibacterium sp. H1 TaxID=3114757 RepID=UPI002E19D801|nr:hypothetical protein [Uliginosibacterium sp. H1]
MDSLHLFGERSLTLVAATFDNRDSARMAATLVRQRCPLATWQVAITGPGEPALSRKLEPEEAGIARTLLRTHALLGLVGMLVGLAAGMWLVASGWPGSLSAPLISTLVIAAFGMLAGLMLGGLLSLRPDHTFVIDRVTHANRSGRWAVVIHPEDTEQTRASMRTLRIAGATPIRSF